jgi:hypothetical protein
VGGRDDVEVGVVKLQVREGSEFLDLSPLDLFLLI